MIDRKRVLALAGSALAVAGILFVAKRLLHYAGQTDLGQLSSGGWLALAGLSLLYGAANTLLGTGWWLLLRRGGEQAGLRWAVRTYGVAQLAKYLPGNIFHLAGRQALGLSEGLSGKRLAASMMWELALCAGAGACLGLLVLPMPFGLIAAGGAAVAAALTLRRWRFDLAFLCFLAFLALAGAVFALLVAVLGPGQGWIAIAGAYGLAWLAGLVVPGAPAGLGVREAVLMVLLAGHADPAQTAEAAILGRMVTLGGDLAFYLACGGGGWNRLFTAIGLIFSLVLQGAVPFLAVPTLGQAVWNGAFAQSFANQGLFAVHAHNFGIPEPAAIAFGLATAWPSGLLIRLGLHPADAYTMMAALWFTLAFFSARHLARGFGAGQTAATLSAVTWLSLPIIWGHAEFSMLSCGMALLPFYALAAQTLRAEKSLSIVLYGAAAVLAVFMDGYSFMMFAVAGGVLLLVRRPALLVIHFIAFALAILLYTHYAGFGAEATAPLEFFRGWGLDLSFAVIPTEGMQWLFDRLHLSVPRSNAVYYGDRSVWETTFCLPVVLAGLACFRRKLPLALAALAIALVGFWLALGPSVKIEAHKTGAEPTMSTEAVPIPTGSAFLSEHVPGFRAMRASYRWEALGLFGIWLLVAMGSRGRYAPLWLSGLILCNLPPVPERWSFDRQQRAMFLAIDQSLTDPLQSALKPGERILFLPYRNDFLPAYLAARLKIDAYNIGGDKNLQTAWKHWPVELRRLPLGGGATEAGVTSVLLANLADAVVLLYPHGLWAAHLWPCLDEADPPLSGKQRANYAGIGDFYCPAEKKAELAPVVEELRRRGDLAVTDAGLFAIVRPE